MASERTDAAEGGGAIKRDNNNRSADDLYIRNDHELQDFWRAILPAFVRTVDPRESGLMDQLFAEDILSESDVESLCGKNVVTRRDQARKLAVSLMKYSWNEFMTMVAPALCDARYTHIIPCKYWITNDQQRTEMTSLRGNGMATTELCLRHIIKHHLRPAALADMLFHHSYMSLEEYRMFISEETSSDSKKWTKIFSTLNKPPSQQAAKETENDLRQRLSRHIDVPDSLSDILLRGLPCCCKERSHENSLPRGKDVLEKLKKRIAERVSPCSTLSRSDGESMTSYSPSSTLRDVSDICFDCDDGTLVPRKALQTSEPLDVQQLPRLSRSTVSYSSLPTNGCSDTALGGLSNSCANRLQKTFTSIPLGSRVGPLHENPTGFFCTSSSNQPQITSTGFNGNIVVPLHGSPTGLSSGSPPNQSHITSIDFLRGNTVTPLHCSSCAISQTNGQQITSNGLPFNNIVGSMHSNPDDMSRGALSDLKTFADSVAKLFHHLQWQKRKCFIITVCVLAIMIQLFTAAVHFAFLFGNLTESAKITLVVFGAFASLCQSLTPVIFLALIITNLQFQNTCTPPTFGHSLHNRHNVSQTQPDGTLVNQSPANP